MIRLILVASLLSGGCASREYLVNRATLDQIAMWPAPEGGKVAVAACRAEDRVPVWLKAASVRPTDAPPENDLVRVKVRRHPLTWAGVALLSLGTAFLIIGGSIFSSEQADADQCRARGGLFPGLCDLDTWPSKWMLAIGAVEAVAGALTAGVGTQMRYDEVAPARRGWLYVNGPGVPPPALAPAVDVRF
jgi:hypothetical protein